MKRYISILFSVLAFSVYAQDWSDAYDKVYDSAATKSAEILKVRKDYRYGLVSANGDVILPPRYEDISPFNFQNDKFARVVYNGKEGFVDKRGKEIVRPMYDAIHRYGYSGRRDWAKVMINGKYGMIDSTGQVVVSLKYDDIGYFKHGEQDWSQVSIGDKFGYMDQEGKIVVPIELMQFQAMPRRRLHTLFDSRRAYIGKVGPVKHFYVSEFRMGYALIISRKTQKVGAINEELELVLSPDFKQIYIDTEGRLHPLEELLSLK